MRARLWFALSAFGGLALMGCAGPQPTVAATAEVRPGAPAEFRIESVQLLQAESWPVQVRLEVSGTLSSACHQVEVAVLPAEADGTIQVELIEQAIEDEQCLPAAEPFRESIPIGNFTFGAYEVLLNGESIGAFDLGSGEDPGAAGQPPGPVFVDEAELETSGENPLEVKLRIHGSLPTPCATLHWASQPPDEQGRIMMEVYSLQPADLDCIQVLQETEVRLPVGTFSEGSYSVWLNGELVGEFAP